MLLEFNLKFGTSADQELILLVITFYLVVFKRCTLLEVLRVSQPIALFYYMIFEQGLVKIHYLLF